METKKDFIKIILWMLVGALIGGVGMISFIFLADKMNEVTIFSTITLWFVHHIFWIQLGVAVLMFAIVFHSLTKASKQLKEKAAVYENDEAEEAFEAAFDGLLNRALILNSAHFTISFVLFGFAMDKGNPLFWASLVLFLAVAVIEALVDSRAIRLMQKNDPVKDADPLALDFQETLLAKCDEAEQLLIYQASWKSFKFMQNALLLAFIITFFVKMLFDTGNFPIVLIGGLWLAQSMSYYYYAINRKA